MQLVGQVLAPGVTRRGEIVEQEEKLAEGYELGRRLVRATKPTAQQPLTPDSQPLTPLFSKEMRRWSLNMYLLTHAARPQIQWW